MYYYSTTAGTVVVTVPHSIMLLLSPSLVRNREETTENCIFRFRAASNIWLAAKSGFQLSASDR
jgi:hypothetical protein